MKKLILAEKPSVAKNIADALKIKVKQDGYFEGNDYIITWAFGHLLQLFDAKDYDSKMAKWKLEHFPFIPHTFQYKVKSSPKNRDRQDAGAAKQLKTIGYLMKRQDVNMIISACDFDREGQIIGDTIISYFQPRKEVYRLLLNEWTPHEVLNGLANIKPNTELEPLYAAGISRQWADWVIGINLTSVATLKLQKGRGQVLNIGRVLLPTLKIIYDRDKEIENFKPETYYKLTSTFLTEDEQEFTSTYMEKENDKFPEKAYLDQIKKAMMKSEAQIIDKQVQEKREYPPYLFNLSNLQGYVTSKFKGFTSDKVLKVAQGLYEKKLITYPRTASVVLEESLVGRAKKVLDTLKKGLPFEDEIQFTKSKRVFDSSKVDSHSAIIPTYMIPKKLSADEMIVYHAIKNRFIAQFMPIAKHEETIITTKSLNPDVLGNFVSKGKVQLVEGWKKVENIESKDTLLPKVNVNDTVSIKEAKVSQNKTKPPKPHTEKTLLRLMETCGKKIEAEDMDAILSGFSIGTPATRAETINKLKRVGYIKLVSKNLQCTELGKNLVETFPVQELLDLEFTGRLEKTLSDIEKRRVAKEQFLDLIFSFTTESVGKLKNGTGNIVQAPKPTTTQREILGKCPTCGHPIIEGQKGFGCSNFKNGCTFVIWKNDKYLASMKKKPTKTMVKQLLKSGEATVKGLTSKKGTKFTAKLRYDKQPNEEQYSWKMEF